MGFREKLEKLDTLLGSTKKVLMGIEKIVILTLMQKQFLYFMMPQKHYISNWNGLIPIM